MKTFSNLSESSTTASSAMTRMRSRILPAKFLSPFASARSRTISSLHNEMETKKYGGGEVPSKVDTPLSHTSGTDQRMSG